MAQEKKEQEPPKPPEPDIKLRFALKSLEADIYRIQLEADSLPQMRINYTTIYETIKAICGEKYVVSKDYSCIPKDSGQVKPVDAPVNK